MTTKRNIEKRLDEIEETDQNPDGYPVIDNLAEFFGYEWDFSEDGEHLARREETGKVYYFDPGFREALLDVFSDESEGQ